MNVSGIRPNERIYSYNSTKLNELRSQQIAAARESQRQRKLEDLPEIQVEEWSRPLEQTYSSYDYAQEYRAGESYDLKGVDSDINQLDVQKALSDMDKDKVLQEYQYFVGENLNTYSKQQDDAGVMLRSGENFIL